MAAWPRIHLLTYRFRDHFESYADIPYSPALVFRYLRRIPGEQLTREYSFESFSREEVDAAVDHSLQLVADMRSSIAAAKVMWFLHQGDTLRAQETLEAYLSAGYSLDSELGVVQKLLTERRSSAERNR